MANEIEEALKRFSKGVEGIVVVNSEGITIKTSQENAIIVQYVELISYLVKKSRSVFRDLDPGDNSVLIRVRYRTR